MARDYAVTGAQLGNRYFCEYSAQKFLRHQKFCFVRLHTVKMCFADLCPSSQMLLDLKTARLVTKKWRLVWLFGLLEQVWHLLR